MSEHNIFGVEGEDIAAEFLKQKGYSILDRNWRSGHKELDIVAAKEEQLVFVEVKTRKGTYYGRPSDAVSPNKMRLIALAADAYVRCYRLDMPVRFDIISIIGSGERMKVEHIEDAFRTPVWYK